LSHELKTAEIETECSKAANLTLAIAITVVITGLYD